MSNIGDDVQVQFTFTELGGTDPADPVEVYVLHRKPDLTETLYEFSIDDEIVKDGVGLYTFTLKLIDARTHVMRPIGVGNVNKSNEVTVEVTESNFLDPMPS